MHIWDSVNCIPLRILADGRTANIISGVCIVISRLLVNFIPDHATKHHHFIVSNFRKIFHLFLEYGELPALPILQITFKHYCIIPIVENKLFSQSISHGLAPLAPLGKQGQELIWSIAISVLE